MTDNGLMLPGELGRVVTALDDVMLQIEDDAVREKCRMLLACVTDDTARVQRSMKAVALAAVEQRNLAVEELEELRKDAAFGRAVRELDLSDGEVRRFLIALKKELTSPAGTAG